MGLEAKMNGKHKSEDVSVVLLLNASGRYHSTGNTGLVSWVHFESPEPQSVNVGILLPLEWGNLSLCLKNLRKI